MLKEHVQFNIPTDDEDTEGMRVAAMVMDDRNDTRHGFISLPKTVSAENAELVIRAIRACMADLEDNCHNHPTQPMRVES
jgi:hypothetical protein